MFGILNLRIAGGEQDAAANILTGANIVTDYTAETVALIGKVQKFKGITSAENLFKDAGTGFAGISSVLNVADAIHNGKWQAHNTIDVVSTGITLVPFVGEAFGLFWFVADGISEVTTDKSLSQNIAHVIGKN